MDARQLEYFLAVVDHGGVNRAASALFLTQPSLSQAIRALERDLGQELFHRVGRRLVLTDAGRSLVEPARDVIRSLAVARDSVSSVAGLATGCVEIASMPSQAVEPLSGMIKAFTEHHPGLRVTVRSAFTAPDVIEMVRTGIAEVGLLGTSEEPVAVGLTMKLLRPQRFVVVAPNGSFSRRKVLKRSDLDGQRVIVGQIGTGMRRVVDEMRADGIELTAVVESEHRESILPLVLGGVGLAVVTESWAPLARQAGADVLDLEPAAYLNIALVSRKAWLSPAAEAFIGIAYRSGR
ncbi:LysR family transcriptional regulator [Kibdelosporangium philippinense]|uniref:LysR family transcriptional regulator n=1 Tax=Kibdelosporangium philippinense TaxID=211113 RepID=A0ABS8Z6K9_9PSEU|nr:LysR family transcriptional regulator [Kibdelosporangium philippinense]MCE7002698.1 LysR family transcriptional regulator [Kibdelosporangium philippinense]